ncbi:hypothetical protein V491_03675, partial [Pseudogymnoascus sp. VKM F-3775]
TAPGIDDSEDEGMGTATPRNQHQRRSHHHHDRNSGGEPRRNGSGASKKHTLAVKKARQESEMPGLTTTVDKQGNPIGGIRRVSQRALVVDKQELSSSSEEGGRGRNKARVMDEVAEWDARDDLRAWTMPSVSVTDGSES